MSKGKAIIGAIGIIAAGAVYTIDHFTNTLDNPERVKTVYIHATATPQDYTVEQMRRYWRNYNKWENDGYNAVIDTSGKLIVLTDADNIVNGVAGENYKSISIAWIGCWKGVDNRTPAQKKTLEKVVSWAKENGFDYAGHRDKKGVKKLCPCYDVKSEYENISD